MTAPTARHRAPVVWISGFSASGKTSVGRRVEAKLRDAGFHAVFLDGDDLRSIFASRWGYTREERVDLARVYFRLCSHLSSQGVTVVISAVAMYDDVRGWLAENVPAAVEVYLDVPEDERRLRDASTKGLYAKVGSQPTMYDLPHEPDLVVPNHGEVSIEESADRIVQFVTSRQFSEEADHGRRAHWSRFYSEAQVPEHPTSFARLVGDRLATPGRLLDVGCGNGRDSSYFASIGVDVLGLDVSEAAIARCRENYATDRLSFFVGDLASLPPDDAGFDTVYSRFCLHAMTPPEEDSFLTEAAARLLAGGRLFIEARSINDPLAREGEVISKTERIAGHYRRFIVPEELRLDLERAGLRVDELTELAGVAKLGEDDPVVVRVTASVP